MPTEYLIRLPNGRAEWFEPNTEAMATGDSPADAACYAAHLKYGPGCSVALQIGGPTHGKPVKRTR